MDLFLASLLLDQANTHADPFAHCTHNQPQALHASQCTPAADRAKSHAEMQGAWRNQQRAAQVANPQETNEVESHHQPECLLVAASWLDTYARPAR